ncbi:MAG: hypothetical protein A2033_17700 [Bacteroidetes bacterium GWA2_31_9]|nr:MAG: hypothetical protein A2033_17700 [Bacteroidetes bacterium GWA2_31_9]
MKFALITEGISEHRIIRHILEKFFKDKVPFIRQIQPQIFNEKQISIGSWNEVLKYCGRTDDLKEIFNNNDYLIIQIDTDKSQTKPFSISHSKIDNTLKSVDELCNEVIVKLKSIISLEIIKEHGNKIFFAICVHSIECWLLPLLYTNNLKSKTHGCIDTLNTELIKKNIHIIPNGNKNNHNAIRTYETILKIWKRKQDIIESSKHNEGFKKFINSLKTIDLTK